MPEPLLTDPAARLLPGDLLADLRSSAFFPSAPPGAPRVGMELELLVLARDGTSLPPNDGEADRTTGMLRQVASSLGWEEGTCASGGPAWTAPGGGTLSLEPGGQVELSSAPDTSVDRLLAGMAAVLDRLAEAADARGAVLAERGIDPLHPVESAPLHLRTPRYLRMSDHFDRIGPAGRRMMRQTACVHVNVDLHPSAPLRWRVAQALAPVLMATFANSPRYQGRETGWRSFRAEQWRRLDPTRTGVLADDDDPPSAYLRFALAADAFLLGPAGAPARPFAHWLQQGVDRSAWRDHLTTLFPEVRPRGYLEVRSADAVPRPWLAVPALLVAGVLYDRESLHEAAAMLPPPDEEALARAGRLGVRNPELQARALAALELAEAGATRLGPAFAGEEALDTLRRFRARFTAAGRDPGDEPGPLDGPAPAPAAGVGLPS